MCFFRKESAMGKHHKPERVKVMLRDENMTKAKKQHQKKLEKRNRKALLALQREADREAQRRGWHG
jgi:hypothetical protein